MNSPISLKKGAELTLTIEGAAFKGKGVAKVDGLAILYPELCPAM